MQHSYSISTLIPSKSFRLLLNNKLFFTPNRSHTVPLGYFIISSQTINHQKNAIPSKYAQFILSEHFNLLKLHSVRNFSSTKAVFSLRGSNRTKEERKIWILNISLVSILLLVFSIMIAMEYHQDYVIIKPEYKK